MRQGLDLRIGFRDLVFYFSRVALCFQGRAVTCEHTRTSALRHAGTGCPLTACPGRPEQPAQVQASALQMSEFCQINPEVWLCVRWLKSSLGSPPQTPVMCQSEHNADFRIKEHDKEKI